ncbi:hypothetical protein SEA_KEELAN_145 [Gordonia phage Keelan]|nr:hypothetical protein SEA_KEELAN_145 [Gordonia phage Keelan]
MVDRGYRILAEMDICTHDWYSMRVYNSDGTYYATHHYCTLCNTSNTAYRN